MKTLRPMKRSSRVLLRFTVSYLLLMLVPLLVGITAYTIATHSASEQIIRTNELALNRAASEVECCLKEAQSFAGQLTRVEPVCDLLNQAYEPREQTVFLRSVIANLPPFQDTYGLCGHYLIYGKGNGILINNQNAYANPARYYSVSFKWGDLSAEEFGDHFLKNSKSTGIHPVTENIWLGKPCRSMLYVLPLVTSARGEGRVLFYIDEAALLSRLQVHFGENAEMVGIYTPDGRPLLSTDNDLCTAVYARLPADHSSGSLNESAGLVSYYYSPSMKATFLVAVPQQYVSRQLSGVKTTMLTGLGIMLFIGLFLAMALFYQNRKPLAAAIDSLPEHGNGEGRSLQWLENAIRAMTESNEQMEESIRMQRFALRSAVIGQLIRGGGPDEEEMEKQLRHVGLSLDGEWFRGLYIHFGQSLDPARDMNDLGDLRRAQIIRILNDFAPRLSYLDLTGRDTCAMLYVGQENEEIDENIFHEMYRRLHEIGEGDAVISVGSQQRNLTGVYHSFLVAEQQLERAEQGNWLIIHKPEAHPAYHFTANDEQRLFNLIAGSRAEEAIQVVEHLREENFIKRNIMGFERQILFYRIVDTIIKAADDPGLFREEQTRIAKMSPEEFFAFTAEKLKEACRGQEDKRASSSNRMLENLYAYLGEHYTDPDMCLTAAAMNFGLTEKYLSAFFKEKSGVNFSNYLENLRIQKATELLREGSLPNQEIAAAVGYASPKTFSRAYYRVTGITPTQAREQ